MTINQSLTIAGLVICLLGMFMLAGFLDAGTQKYMASWCNSQEPETAQEWAYFNAYCE